MNFKSLDFVLVFPVLLLVVFMLPQRLRWAWLLAGSLFFYSRWKAIYILLLLAHSLTDYVLGMAIHRARTQARKRLFLGMSLFAGLGLLAYFKYLGFFASAAYDVMALAGHPGTPPHFDIVLPVGISFYTFQTLSYTIDMYRGQIVPEKHPGYFMLFVTYFPHMVAGPIMRSTTLLGELHKPTRWDSERIASGFRRMAWGFFKKIVVADRLARAVEFAYGNVNGASGAFLLVATYFFVFQVYADFSGYSDIALGAARMLGHDLTENFDRPYFSTSISTFWRRWHISLQTWFRDYLFIPLMRGKTGLFRQSVVVLVVFTVSGLWHGANWTFIVWGLVHGVALVSETTTRSMRERIAAALRIDRLPAALKGVIGAVLTFHVVVLADIFFVSHDVRSAFTVIRKILAVRASEFAALNPRVIVSAVVILMLLGVEAWQGVRGGRVEDLLEGRSTPFKIAVVVLFVLAFLLFGNFGTSAFIYFQF